MTSSAAPTQSLHEFVHTTPAPVVAVLVDLGPYVARIRRALEIVSWKPVRAKATSWPDGWLAVALWWALCLGVSPALRYIIFWFSSMLSY
jgi:hypothetical protein